jgi:SAM-dependent methyltransferase
MSANLLTWEEAVKWLISQPNKQELVRSCYYDDPLESVAERFTNSEEWLAVENLLQKYIPGSVLDLGAGRGISSYAFAKSDCSVTALEPDPSPLVGAKAIQALVDSSQLPIQIIQEYGETLPFQENTFDIVYGRAVLHHAHDLKKLCQEAARVLKPGGVFLATREHVISKKEDLPKFLDSHPLHFLYGGENAYLLQEYREAMRLAGLKLQKVFAPYESVINYAPITHKEFQSRITSGLSRILDSKFASELVATKGVQQFAGWYASLSSDAPGRLYTFLGMKQ